MAKSKKTKVNEIAEVEKIEDKKTYNGPLIYVGPGFRDSVLSTFAIFADGVPDEFKGTTYEKLFVKPEQLNEARAEIGKTGTALHTFYMMAVDEHDKKGGK